MALLSCIISISVMLLLNLNAGVSGVVTTCVSVQALKRLIAAGAKMQCKSETDSSSLQCAAASGSFPVFSHLLQVCTLC